MKRQQQRQRQRQQQRNAKRIWNHFSKQSPQFALGIATGSMLTCACLVLDARRETVSSAPDDVPPSGNKNHTGQPMRSNVHGVWAPTLPVALYNPNPSIEIAFDTRTRNPLYALERYDLSARTDDDDDDNHDRTPQNLPKRRFYEETTLPPQHRSRNAHYRHSGYDRGHLAAAANPRKLPLVGDTDVEQAWLDTFTLLNISPQIPSFNSGVWLALETLVRKLLLEEQQPFEAQQNRAAIIITGPVWLPSEVVTHSNHNTNVTSKPCFRYDYRGIGTLPQTPKKYHFKRMELQISTQLWKE